jgi:hypothetical protein
MINQLRVAAICLASISTLSAQETAYCEGKLPFSACEQEALKTDSARNKRAKNAPVVMHEPIEVFLDSPVCSVGAEFTALFLKPTGSHHYYAAEAIPLPVETPSWEIYEVNPGYKFGFDVGLAWFFHSLNTTLSTNWTRLHCEESESFTVPLNSDMIGPFFSIGPQSSIFKNAQASSRYHFDEVSLNYGTCVRFGDRLFTNLYAGAAYARIKQTLNSVYSNLAGDVSLAIDTPSTFTGGGPHVGVDFAYRIAGGLHLTGDATFDLFTGRLENHTDYKTTSPLLVGLGYPNPNYQSTTVPNRLDVIPGFEGRLGLAYSVSFGKHYVIDLEAGYETKIYVNAVQSVDMGSEVDTEIAVVNAVGVYARTFQRTVSNFALSGPYATLAFGF